VLGVSFTEIAVIALVALIFVGPEKLPKMLYTLGQWVGKLRRLTTEVRAQTGIDELLRQEGFEGGLRELRGLLRGDIAAGRATYDEAAHHGVHDPYEAAVALDRTREYPVEGADAHGALADDLVDESSLEPAADA
jgi:sec-independent protein translocase protein TatB